MIWWTANQEVGENGKVVMKKAIVHLEEKYIFMTRRMDESNHDLVLHWTYNTIHDKNIVVLIDSSASAHVA